MSMIRSVDWPLVLRDLASAGVSRHRLALTLEIEPSSLQRTAEGSEPRHGFGMAILRIHAEHCGNELTQQRIADAKVIA